jgi:hypothetical protein
MASRVLPFRAVNLIREYSHPMTRPDWRDSMPIISQYELMEFVSTSKYVNKYKKHAKLHYYILDNIIKTDWYREWYHMYMYITCYGVLGYCSDYNKKYHDIISINGVQRAQFLYEN